MSKMCSRGHIYEPASKHGRCPVCARDKDRSTDPHRKILDSYEWQVARKQALARDGGCVYTGNGGCYGRTEVHHLISVRRGGEPYALSNLVTVCRGHHEFVEAAQRKAARLSKGWPVEGL